MRKLLWKLAIAGALSR